MLVSAAEVIPLCKSLSESKIEVPVHYFLTIDVLFYDTKVKKKMTLIWSQLYSRH